MGEKRNGAECEAKRWNDYNTACHRQRDPGQTETVGEWSCTSKNDQAVANSENSLPTSIPRSTKRSFAPKSGATPGHAFGATSFGARTTRSDGATSWRFNAVDANGTARERSVTRAITAIGGSEYASNDRPGLGTR
jgi:hypothetical protein